MTLIETYLLYLYLSETEWGTPTQNPDSFDISKFADLLGSDKSDLSVFKKMRHHLQPSIYDLYIKNALGDYMGRPDTMNSQTMRHVGFDQFKRDIEILKKRSKFATKEKNKTPLNFFKNASPHGETNDPSFIGDAGDSAGDGGGDGGSM